MYLSKLAILNYKSCKSLVLDFSENLPNTFIGKTDAGKSTILNAIGLLLDEKSNPDLVGEGQETSDLSTTPTTNQEYKTVFSNLDLPEFESDTNSVILVGIFNIQEGELETGFDDDTSNHLKWAIQSYSDEQVAVLRQFNDQYPKGRYFLCAKDKMDETLELWNKNQTDLGNLRKEHYVTTEDIANANRVGRYKNIELFQAIYNKIDTSEQWGEYREFAKKDRGLFPTFKYIDWKMITLEGIEELAKQAVSTVLEEYDEKLRGQALVLSSEATEKVNNELKHKFDQIRHELKNITSIRARVHYEPKKSVSEISVEKTTSDGSVKLGSQGDGIKKRIGFAFMRFAALENLDEKAKIKKHLWAFDEPEIHLYPPEKREFYEVIKTLSTGIFQSFISTHSTVFVDRSQLNTIRKVELKDKYSSISICSSVSDIHESLGIKNSDFLFYDVFIAGEGDSEEILVPHFYKLYFNRRMEEDSIQFINLGGKSKWETHKKIFEQILQDYKDPEKCLFCVLDNDTNTTGENIYLVGKYDIEDSISDEHWIKLVKELCGVNLARTDLERIRSELTSERDKKFHKLLTDEVAAKPEKSDFLPSKKDCAGFMLDAITDSKEIPENLIRLFADLEKKGLTNLP